jgi:hypothetical protein
MKGPYERLKYDLRRLWECPVCKRRERTDGGVTFRHCDCGTKQPGGQPVVMRLIADGPQRLVPVIAGTRESAEDSPVVVPVAATEMASGVHEHADGSDVATTADEELASSDSPREPKP